MIYLVLLLAVGVTLLHLWADGITSKSGWEFWWRVSRKLDRDISRMSQDERQVYADAHQAFIEELKQQGKYDDWLKAKRNRSQTPIHNAQTNFRPQSLEAFIFGQKIKEHCQKETARIDTRNTIILLAPVILIVAFFFWVSG